MLVLAALWWAWAAYAWLTNYIAAEEDRERLLMLAVMGAFLVAALAVPEAFGDDALAVRASPTPPRAGSTSSSSPRPTTTSTPGEAIRRLSRTALPAPLLLIVRGLPRRPRPGGRLGRSRSSTDFAGPYIFGVRGFRVSPATSPSGSR